MTYNGVITLHDYITSNVNFTLVSFRLGWETLDSNWSNTSALESRHDPFCSGDQRRLKINRADSPIYIFLGRHHTQAMLAVWLSVIKIKGR